MSHSERLDRVHAARLLAIAWDQGKAWEALTAALAYAFPTTTDNDNDNPIGLE